MLSGGGVKGLATLGALKRLEELKKIPNFNIDIREIMGVSVGAIIGFLYAIGYSPKELIDVLLEKDFRDLTDTSIMSIINSYGIDSGDTMLGYIKSLADVKKSSKMTFKELLDKTGIKLRVCTTNLTRNSQVVFDYTNYPNLPVLKAIRMSFSIPFVFSCVNFEDCVYIDGGLSDNYPIEFYEHDLDKTFGIQLTTDPRGMEAPSFMKYISAVIKCIKLQIEDKAEGTSTLNINASGISAVSFDIEPDVKKDLLHIGYSSCVEFFDHF